MTKFNFAHSALRGLTAVSAVALLSTSCSDGPEQPNPRQEIVLSRAESEILADDNTFAMEWLGVVSAENDNFVVSPFSLSSLITLASNGLEEGEAAAVMEEIHSAHADLNDANAYYTRMRGLLDEMDNKVVVGQEYSLWYGKELAVKPGFSNCLNRLGGDSFGVDFEDPSKPYIKKIKGWVKEMTKGVIADYDYKDKSNKTNRSFLLFNSLVFKAPWTTKFERSRELPFHVNGSKREVKMMGGVQECQVLVDDNFEAVRIPYGNGSFSMAVVMPTEKAGGVGPALVEGGQVAETLRQLIGRPADKREVYLPFFEVTTNIDLIDHLKRTGIFGHLSQPMVNMFDNYAPSIIESEQQCMIKVDDKGTTAAAVTKFVGGATSVGPDGILTIDHPFFFFVTEESTGAILFMGQITNP